MRRELRWDLYISPEVNGEIKDPKSRKVRDSLLNYKVLKIYDAPIDLDKKIRLKYEQLRKKMGVGEASCYAIAFYTNLSVASLDSEAHEEACKQRPVEMITLYEIFYLLNKCGVLSEGDIENLIEALDSLPDFKVPYEIKSTGYKQIKQMFNQKYQKGKK